MLRGMTWCQLLEWKKFYQLDPPLLERSDYNTAHIVQLLARTGKPLFDFLLPFGDAETMAVPMKQPVEHQERILEAWIMGSNALLSGKGVQN